MDAYCPLKFVFSDLCFLNKESLQGRNKTIFIMLNLIKAFKEKLQVLYRDVTSKICNYLTSVDKSVFLSYSRANQRICFYSTLIICRNNAFILQLNTTSLETLCKMFLVTTSRDVEIQLIDIQANINLINTICKIFGEFTENVCHPVLK